jgi:hypothetical protein
MLPKNCLAASHSGFGVSKHTTPRPNYFFFSTFTVLVQITDYRPPQDGVTLFFLRLFAALTIFAISQINAKKSKPFTDDED